MKQTKIIILKRGSTFFLRAAILAIGIIVLALCIFALPATWRAVPGEYPDITYAFYCIILAMYGAVVPFFIALYQGMRLLSFIDKNKAFSQLSVKALKCVAYCGVAISAFYGATMPFFYVWAESDDAPGLIIISMMLTLAPLVVTVLVTVVQRLLRDAIAMKSENDLTV